MWEEIRSGYTRSKDGGIAHWREFIPEIGTGDNSSSGVGGWYSQGITDSHQSNTDGGNSGPWGSRHHRDDAGDDACAGKEKGWRHDLYTIIYQCGYHTTDHPGSWHHSDEQQDQDRYSGIAHGLFDHLFKDIPFHPIDAHTECYTNGCGYHEGHLRGTSQGIIREDFDNQDDEGDKYCQRYDRNKRMWFNWLQRRAGCLILCSLRFLFLFFLFHLLIFSFHFSFSFTLRFHPFLRWHLVAEEHK